MNRVPLILFALNLCAQSISLKPEAVEIRGGQKLEAVTYKGRAALRFVDRGEVLGVVKGTDFHNGTLEVDLAAEPAKNAVEGARGFAGLAFRITEPGRYEAIYLRPTNGRADDQLRRNHSTQYISEPEWPWPRLRGEAPGVYESYVDLVPGEWTHVKIVVKDARAELYVGQAGQPVLIVTEMKKGDTHGPIGLWIGLGTDAYFANLKIQKEN